MLKFLVSQKPKNSEIKYVKFHDELTGKTLKVEESFLESLLKSQPVKGQAFLNPLLVPDDSSLFLAIQGGFINKVISRKESVEENAQISSSPMSFQTRDPFEELGRTFNLSSSTHYDSESDLACLNYDSNFSSFNNNSISIGDSPKVAYENESCTFEWENRRFYFPEKINRSSNFQNFLDFNVEDLN